MRTIIHFIIIWYYIYSLVFCTELLNDSSKLAAKIILVFIAVLTIVGNTLVLLVTWRERRLHEPNKYFIACLAVADLLVGIFLAPLRVHQLNLDSLTQSFTCVLVSLHLCRFLKWVDTLALTASIYSLTFISVDRYLKISKPLQYKSIMTTSRSLKIIFIIWFISTALASYAATPHSGMSGILINLDLYCPYDSTKTLGFYTFLVIAEVFLPIITMSVMYTLIFVAVHKRQKMLQNGQLVESPTDHNQRTVFLQNLKAIRMLLVVVGMFIFCWGSFLFYGIIKYYQQKHFDQKVITEQIMFLLPYFNSLCNPVIYACLDQKYR